MYIVIDGADATSKSTQVAMLAERLARDGHRVFVTKEPGGTTALGAKIREILIDSDTSITPHAALCLFLADRCQNMVGVQEALDAGKIVISDRSSFSSFVYFAAAMTEADTLEVAGQIAPLLDFAQQVRPDWCFVCSADFEWSRKQLAARAQLDRIEQMGDQFHKRTHEFFKPYYLNRLATKMQNAPNKIWHVSPASSASKEQISDQIYDILDLPSRLLATPFNIFEVIR